MNEPTVLFGVPLTVPEPVARTIKKARQNVENAVKEQNRARGRSDRTARTKEKYLEILAKLPDPFVAADMTRLANVPMNTRWSLSRHMQNYGLIKKIAFGTFAKVPQ